MITNQPYPFKVFAGSTGTTIAQRICSHLGCELGKINIQHFSDGEYCVSFEETVRGHAVYLVQSTCPSADNLMELLLMIDAARRASAYKVIAVTPYFGWARQDRKDKPRVSIAAKLVANMLQVAGADRVITIDLHAEQIQGFFDIPVDHLYGAEVLATYVEGLKLENLLIASPDIGGSKRAASFVKRIASHTHHDVPMVICYKNRQKANKVSELRVLGKVKGMDVVIIDDIADTAGTLCAASEVLLENGATKIIACATHADLSGPAIDRINATESLNAVFVTDTIPLGEKKERCSKLHVVGVGSLLGKAISNIHTGSSVSVLFV